MSEFRIQYEGSSWEAETWEDTLEAAKQALLRNGEGTVDIQQKTDDGRWDSVAYLKLKWVA